jgi:hypothetical protein
MTRNPRAEPALGQRRQQVFIRQQPIAVVGQDQRMGTRRELSQKIVNHRSS